jgi:hypothetical protein
VKHLPRWRIVAAAAVLAALAFFAARFAPIYWRNIELQSFVTALPERAAGRAQSGSPPADDQVRAWVLEKARQLDLPVEAGDVRIFRAAGSGRMESIDVHYQVRVDLPGYTVNLHFYPGAGSR